MQINDKKTPDERSAVATQAACAVGGTTAMGLWALSGRMIGVALLSSGWGLPVAGVMMLTYAGAEQVDGKEESQWDFLNAQEEPVQDDASVMGEMPDEA